MSERAFVDSLSAKTCKSALTPETQHFANSLMHHSFLSTDIQALLERSQQEVSLQISSLSTTIEASQTATLAQLDHQLQSMEQRIIKTVRQTTSQPQEPASLARITWCPANAFRRGSRCDMHCTCQCHQGAKFSRNMRMTLFQSVIGVAAVVYSNWGSRPCFNPSCRSPHQGGSQQSIRDIHIIYHLPDWLSRVSISLFVSNNLNGSPQMHLRMYNRRDWGEGWTPRGLLHLVECGDVEGVKTVLRNGNGTVYDLYGENDISPLWLAFVAKKTSIISLLLRAGADPFVRLSHGRSVMDGAFLNSNSSDADDVARASLFPVSCYVEDLDLPNLHLAIIGNNNALLSSLLQTTACIDQPTCIDQLIQPTGISALHLAALRGDHAAVKLLIRYGATVDVLSTGGNAPLYSASRCGNYSVVSELLRAGADPNHFDKYGRQAIHGACTARRQAVEIISLLLQHGAHIEPPAPKTYFTPLVTALSSNHVDVVKFILSRGGNPSDRGELVGEDGLPSGAYQSFNLAMENAILERDPAKVEVLLEYGAKLEGVGGENNWGVLHRLATSGTEELMRLFLRPEYLERLRGVSTVLKDTAGKTPMAVFAERTEKDEELRAAFEALLDAVEGLAMGLVEGEVEDEVEDVFFDAKSGMG